MSSIDHQKQVVEIAGTKPRRPFPIGKLLIYSILILLSIVFLAPLVWMLSTSVKTDMQLSAYPPAWIPKPFDLSYYGKAFEHIKFFTLLKNSLIIVGWNLAGNLISSALVAYGLSRIAWPGRNIVFALVISTMIIPYQVVMAQQYMLFNGLKWIGTFLPLIVPAFFATSGFAVFLIRQFFMTIPDEISQAARIDGAGEFQIFYGIILPLSKGVLFTLALFTFLYNWNDYLAPLIYIQHENQYTLALGLGIFRGARATLWQELMAISTIMTLPIIVLFFFTQRTFIEGITLGAMKG